MKKYYIGFIVLAIVTLGLAIYVVGMGVQGKQDRQTETRAKEIAKDLNTYVRTNNKIPTSLEDAKITDVPSTITYDKIDSTRYEFCVEYKTSSRGYSTSSVSQVLFDATSSTALDADYNDYGSSSYSSYEPSTLYLSYGHTKGKNCQKVKPYIRRQSTYESTSPSYCDPDSIYYETYQKYCN